MDLFMDIVIYLVFCCVWKVAASAASAESRKSSSILAVPNGAKWGKWTSPKFCTSGYVNGFAIRVQEPAGITEDDTSLNDIRLYCTSGETITFGIAGFGQWSEKISCSKGYLNSFSLNVEKSQGILDDTGANNIQFKCQNGDLLKLSSYEWGTFGPWSKSCDPGAICGSQAKVEEPLPIGDNTGLNDIIFYCCD
ncbi:vitelline membrane outer layer protein 1-like [Anolis sagrei]|uniref:vitelline membrane outer layer protein 1-like n=1 Tax=Anolis sagrei TaxID=38937 RepID=UPI003522C0B2